MKRHLALVCLLVAGMGALPGALAEETSDWPCIQRKVPEIALAAAWQGPDFDPATLTELRKDPAVTNLADLLAARRTTQEEAKDAIAKFASEAGAQKHDKILAVVAVLFDRLNADRADIMAGLERFGRKQKALAERVRGDLARLREENPGWPVPVDLVTTSGSGLDPDISPEAALFQVPRVAKARKLPEDRVRQLVTENTKGRLAGILGEPRVNVLALNLALNAATVR